jgi:hypothetical protein
VLIGPGADEIYKHRRSILKGYFNSLYGPAKAIAN